MTENDSGSKFAIGFLFGALIGAGVALLYAPRSGSETRAILREKAEVAREKAMEIVEEAREKAGEIIATAKAEAETIKQATKK